MAVGNPSCREHWMKDGWRFDKGLPNLPVKTHDPSVAATYFDNWSNLGAEEANCVPISQIK
ncbi:hypothetical protein YC2023_099971 [Brassica napus]